MLLLASPAAGNAADVELLHKSGKSWDGGGFHYPPGVPEISILRISLEAGEETPFHCHPIPTFGYVLKGKLEVRTGDGNRILFKEGQAAIEVMGTLHRGRAMCDPVEILVFYTGAENLENSIPAGKEGCT